MPFAFGPHLLYHDLLYLTRRLNILEFHPRHLDAPCVGSLIKYDFKLAVYLVARGECLVKLHAPYYVTKRSGGEVLKTRYRILDTVRIEPRIKDLGAQGQGHKQLVRRLHGQ